MALWCVGFNTSSISWNSIYPGEFGAYNSWLSCTQQCDTVVFTPGLHPPAYIDYRVSGTPQNTCNATLADTVRAYIHELLQVGISPIDPVVCFDSSTTTLSCTLTGGASPYTVQWSNGSSDLSTHLPAGPQWLRYADQSACPADTLFFTINQLLQPPTVDAGYLCLLP